jgi:hypothetical protein
MKPVTGLLKVIALVVMIIPLMSESCEDEKNAGYYHVSIPSYNYEEYYKMLFYPNEEIQYNAICNLHAEFDADALNVDSLKGTPRYTIAKKTYDKIYAMMDAENSWVSSAAIRYIGLHEYNRQGFIDYILSNINPSENVQLACWYGWKKMENDELANSAKLMKKVNFCLNHPSWLIKQTAFGYLTKATVPYYEDTLIKTYDNSNEQYQKLEILEVLNLHLCDTVFNFLIRNYTTSSDSLINKQIILSLKNTLNKQQSLNWFKQHKKEAVMILNEGIDFSGEYSDFYTGLIQIALSQGWDPAQKKYTATDKQEYPLLYYYVLEDKYHFESTDTIKPKQSPNLKKIEQQLLADSKLRPAWLQYEKTHMRFSLPDKLVKAHQKLTNEYEVSVLKLFEQNKTDSAVANIFLVQLRNASTGLYRSKYVKN